MSDVTITDGDNGSGYRHKNKTVQGFSLIHMSGVGADVITYRKSEICVQFI